MRHASCLSIRRLSSCSLRAEDLVPGQFALAGWKVAVSFEQGGTRDEHERAEWKCTRGHLRLTWTSANNSTSRWRQLTSVVQWRRFLEEKCLESKKLREKKVVKRVWTGGCGEPGPEETADVYFVSCWETEEKALFFATGKKWFIWLENEDALIFFGWRYFKQLFISRNKSAWVRPPRFFSFLL